MRTLIGLFLILFSACSYGQASTEINFVWGADKLNSHTFEHASMRIPVTFKSDTTTYYLQFDTAPHILIFIVVEFMRLILKKGGRKLLLEKLSF